VCVCVCVAEQVVLQLRDPRRDIRSHSHGLIGPSQVSVQEYLPLMWGWIIQRVVGLDCWLKASVIHSKRHPLSFLVCGEKIVFLVIFGVGKNRCVQAVIDRLG